MPSRLRQFLESILYVGLKPDAPRREPGRGGFGSLRERFERLLAGRAPSDPLYLSNRTWKQKLKIALAAGCPVVLLLGLLVWMFSRSPERPAPAPQTGAPIDVAASLLPNIEKTIESQANPDAEIVEAHIEGGEPAKVVGTLRNKTERAITVEFVMELTDAFGSRLGAVKGRMDNAAPKADSRFQFAIIQSTAAFALVREIRTVK